MGVGAIIGTGIFVVIGEGAAIAGPAVILSFALAALACVFSALSYAELASSIPVAGAVGSRGTGKCSSELRHGDHQAGGAGVLHRRRRAARPGAADLGNRLRCFPDGGSTALDMGSVRCLACYWSRDLWALRLPQLARADGARPVRHP